MDARINAMTGPTLPSVLAIYAKAGNTTFGGGDPTMAVLQRELCERRNWLTADQFALAFSLARVTPGTNVLAFCAATGHMMLGWVASIGTVLAASAPSAVLAVWLTVAFQSSSRNPVTQSAVNLVLAAVVGMMAASVWMLAKPSFTRSSWMRVVLLTGGTVLLRELWLWSPVEIMGVCALIGVLWKGEE
jgi:chromate transporter